MNKLKKVLVLVLVAGFVSLGLSLTGCKKAEPAKEPPPAGEVTPDEHPAGEEHPAGKEHPDKE